MGSAREGEALMGPVKGDDSTPLVSACHTSVQLLPSLNTKHSQEQDVMATCEVCRGQMQQMLKQDV